MLPVLANVSVHITVYFSKLPILKVCFLLFTQIFKLQYTGMPKFNKYESGSASRLFGEAGSNPDPVRNTGLFNPYQSRYRPRICFLYCTQCHFYLSTTVLWIWIRIRIWIKHFK
jgi:hypothetical protein